MIHCPHHPLRPLGPRGPLRPYSRLIRAGLALAICVSAATAARAADVRETGRRLAKDLEMAVVNIRIVITTADGNDHAMEASGTVISPEGLTVVPLNSVDPMSLARRIRSDESGAGANTRVKDIKLLVNKRTEVPATVVLRDDDLNIALLRPRTRPAQPMKCVNLDESADGQLLEQVFVLARMGRVADRELGAMTGEIQAVVTRPRKFYIPSSELASGGYGVPIFNAGAKLIGVVVIRINVGAVDSQNDIVGIILPAKELKDFVAQAPPEGAKAKAQAAAIPLKVEKTKPAGK